MIIDHEQRLLPLTDGAPLSSLAVAAMEAMFKRLLILLAPLVLNRLKSGALQANAVDVQCG